MANGYPEYNNLTNFRVPTAQLPGESGDLKNIQQQQIDFSNNFRKNKGALGAQLLNNYARDARAELANNLTKSKASFNARGLLRSGQKIGADAGLKAATESDIRLAKKDINQGLDDQGNYLDSLAFNTAGVRAGMNPGLGQGILAGLGQDVENDISNMQAQQAIYGGLAQGIGNFAGTYYGRKK